eukprot:TRINITY_DN221_c0_g1_i3.p1 TRINITY_DN221_c0_g1~~TRINITY_DN221_c0_g1_i3.p1  ORF type:complete len:658 (-),score=109.08 TRINITY_DN221_c0_g1_i3:3022-4863(-)
MASSFPSSFTFLSTQTLPYPHLDPSNIMTSAIDSKSSNPPPTISAEATQHPIQIPSIRHPPQMSMMMSQIPPALNSSSSSQYRLGSPDSHHQNYAPHSLHRIGHSPSLFSIPHPYGAASYPHHPVTPQSYYAWSDDQGSNAGGQGLRGHRSASSIHSAPSTTNTTTNTSNTYTSNTYTSNTHTSSRSSSSSPLHMSVSFGAARKRRSWTREEDERLAHAVQTLGIESWQRIADAMGQSRTRDQCYQRWVRALRPGIRKGAWTDEEDQILRQRVQIYGVGCWREVAKGLEGRTDQQCRRHWSLVKTKVKHPQKVATSPSSPTRVHSHSQSEKSSPHAAGAIASGSIGFDISQDDGEGGLPHFESDHSRRKAPSKSSPHQSLKPTTKHVGKPPSEQGIQQEEMYDSSVSDEPDVSDCDDEVEDELASQNSSNRQHASKHSVVLAHPWRRQSPEGDHGLVTQEVRPHHFLAGLKVESLTETIPEDQHGKLESSAFNYGVVASLKSNPSAHKDRSSKLAEYRVLPINTVSDAVHHPVGFASMGVATDADDYKNPLYSAKGRDSQHQQTNVSIQPSGRSSLNELALIASRFSMISSSDKKSLVSHDELPEYDQGLLIV